MKRYRNAPYSKVLLIWMIQWMRSRIFQESKNSLLGKETQHVCHHYNATGDHLTTQASYYTASVDCFLCHHICRGMDCHAAPGAGPEWPWLAALHYPRSRALSAVLLLCGTGCDRRANSSLLYRDGAHCWKSRGAAVGAALCALAGWGALVPAR